MMCQNEVHVPELSESFKSIYEIVSAQRNLTHIFKKSELTSTHCCLRTENRSICHRVVRL